MITTQTMGEYRAWRNRAIGFAMCRLYEEGGSFTCSDFKAKVKEFERRYDVAIVTPIRGYFIGSVPRISGGCDFSEYDRVHKALQKLVEQGYLTFNCDGPGQAFHYYFTDKNWFPRKEQK